MADRVLYPQRAVAPNLQWVAGKFRPNGSSAIDNTLNVGVRFTAVRTSQGLYTVTLTDKFSAIFCVLPSIELASATARIPQAQSVAVTSGAVTFVIQNLDTSATAQDIASATGNWIHFGALVQNSSVAA